MDKIVIGSLLILAGFICLMAIWFPRIRPRWKGSSVTFGPLSCTGFAAFFTGLGAATLSSGFHLPSSCVLFFIIFAVSGWILGIVGSKRDGRHDRDISNLTIDKSEKQGKSISPRLVGFVIAIALGDFLFLQARSAWTNYWLLQDGQQGMAIVTNELWSGHNAVGYRYTVNEKEYTGRSGRNWKIEKYSKVPVGGESVVYFSASHPWLSLLYEPRTVIEGLPVVIIVMFFEFFAVATIISPGNKWAFDLSDKKTKQAS